MGRINNGAMKDWSNGNIVTAELYEADHEMLRVAINDNFDRLTKSITVLNADGSTKTTKNMDTAFNFLKIKDGAGVSVALDTTSGVLTITAVPAAGSIGNAQIADNSITTAKIVDGAVTEAKLAAGSVTTGKIGAGAVTEGNIADQSVSASKIVDGSITASKLDITFGDSTPAVLTHNADRHAHNFILQEEADLTSYDTTNKIYTKVYFRRENGTLHAVSNLGNLSGGTYLRDTWDFYDDGGSSIVETLVWVLTYNADKKVIKKELL